MVYKPIFLTNGITPIFLTNGIKPKLSKLGGNKVKYFYFWVKDCQLVRLGEKLRNFSESSNSIPGVITSPDFLIRISGQEVLLHQFILLKRSSSKQIHFDGVERDNRFLLVNSCLLLRNSFFVEIKVFLTNFDKCSGPFGGLGA